MLWPSCWYRVTSHDFPSSEHEQAGAVPPQRSRQGRAACRQQGSQHAHFLRITCFSVNKLGIFNSNIVYLSVNVHTCRRKRAEGAEMTK